MYEIEPFWFYIICFIFDYRKDRNSSPERQNLDWKHKNSWNQADPEPFGALRRNAGNAQSHEREGNGSDLPRPVPSRAGGCYHRCSGLSALPPDLHEDPWLDLPLTETHRHWMERHQPPEARCLQCDPHNKEQNRLSEFPPAKARGSADEQWLGFWLKKIDFRH